MKRLGSLESDVMNVLWDAESPMSVHDILDALPSREFAYTTILTVVTNLFNKDFVTRTKVSRSYRYLPAETREEATSQTLREILNTSSNSAGVLMHFAQTVTPEELDVLRDHLPHRNRRRR
ncbi:BlaI/MecI/CopY family transcriptional regulator [Williamsia herbipolensis]|uniref:BlaI/MecI/CopY family transcriptional regulator n=1 Tax=Williamsia herbipolensis TaxID=1603258 RepID=UPI0005F7C427|nr:BlaI/MecI/CopY family transcriptional regulator [Williamsia herbipolensis]